MLLFLLYLRPNGRWLQKKVEEDFIKEDEFEQENDKDDVKVYARVDEKYVGDEASLVFVNSTYCLLLTFR